MIYSVQEDRLNALCSGVDLLSQLVANGEENDPKLRGQLLQLTSAIVSLLYTINTRQYNNYTCTYIHTLALIFSSLAVSMHPCVALISVSFHF